MRNKRRTDEEWLSLIQECRNSGFSDRAWCEQNEIPINTFYNAITRLRRKSCVISVASGSTMERTPEIVPLSFVADSHVQTTGSVRQLSPDHTSGDEALTIIMNGCKVTVNNHAGRDVIYHTLSALREL